MDFLNWPHMLGTISERIAAMLPAILASMFLLAAGWAAAHLGGVVTRRILARAADRIERRFEGSRFLRASGLVRAAPKALERFVYWAVLLFFAAAALEKLSLPIVAELFQSVAQFLPQLLLAVTVVFVGSAAANLTHHWIADIGLKAGVEHAQILGRLAQGGVFVVALIVGFQQVGIASGVLVSLATVILASTLGGMAIAFGLGAGPVVTNLMASYYASKVLGIGDAVRVGEIEGTILEITSSSIVVGMDGNRVYLPAKKFCDEVSVVIGEANERSGS